MDTTPLFEFSDRAELRQWLEENHGTTPFCWVATTRGKEPRRGAVPYPEVVEECLCFGWIDSTLKRLDEGRQAQRIFPRKKGSTWTVRNTRRFRDLEERGLVTEAGWKAFREADGQGGWFEFTPDLFGSAVFAGRTIPCISVKGQRLFHAGYELRKKDIHDLEILAALD